MIRKFKDVIRHELAIRDSQVLLVGVSGGRDSVCLCDLLDKIGQPFAIAHCNFSLRGSESDEDAVFAASLATRYEVPFHLMTFDTQEEAKRYGKSIQETARLLRYNWFQDLVQTHSYTKVLVGHHLDDSIETVLFHLIRGTGIAGLHGIPMTNGTIARPLLFADRMMINTYIETQQLPFREDSSNKTEKYARNKIRHAMIPLMREMNPSLSESFRNTVQQLQQTEAIFQEAIEEKRKSLWKPFQFGHKIAVAALKELASLETYLYEWLKPYGFHSVKDIIGLLDSQTGKMVYSKTHRVIRDRTDLIVTGLAPSHKTYRITMDIKGIACPVDMVFDIKSPLQEKFRQIAELDIGKLDFPLELRTWRQGDYFYPEGMRGKKKLSDYYTDLKMSIPEKENTWILCAGSDIIWVIGHRIDRRFKLGDNREKAYIVGIK